MELRAKQLSVSSPILVISDEDVVPQELLPRFVKGFTLTVVVETASENGFGIFQVGGENGALASSTAFGGPYILGDV